MNTIDEGKDLVSFLIAAASRAMGLAPDSPNQTALYDGMYMQAAVVSCFFIHGSIFCGK